MSYDSPNAAIRREFFGVTTAGSGGVHRFRSFQKVRLTAVHAIVLVAGTSNSPGHALTIKNGTTSVGLLAIGTATAGSIVSNDAINEVVASLELMSLTNGTDATGTANVIYEYEVIHDAVKSP